MNAIANFALIPTLGIIGAAFATLLAEVVVLIVAFHYYKALIGPPRWDGKFILKYMAVVATLLASEVLMPDFYFIFRILTILCAYVILLQVMNIFPLSEILHRRV